MMNTLTENTNRSLQQRGSGRENTNLIAAIDSQNAGVAIHRPSPVDAADQPWLERWRTRQQLSAAQRKNLVGAADIAVKRQLATMEIAAEGVIVMARQQWDALVQLHGARTVQEFAGVFLRMQNDFMDEIVAANVETYCRAASEAERIETSLHPEFVKAQAREENLRRFNQELGSVRRIGDRIGDLLATRIGQANRA
jgi:hypothetical protein